MKRSELWPYMLTWLQAREGGFVNDPADPGGATYCGVALRTVQGLDADGDGRLDFDLDGDGDVDARDIAALKDHPEKLEAFYVARYWAPVRGPELPPALALFALDSAVLHGVGPAAVLLQRGLGVTADGVIGFRTLAAAHANGPEALDHCLTERDELLQRIVEQRPASGRFLKGWKNRLFALAREATNLHAVASAEERLGRSEG